MNSVTPPPNLPYVTCLSVVRACACVVVDEATARLSEKAPLSEKNITLSSTGWDLANIVSIMRHLLVF